MRRLHWCSQKSFLLYPSVFLNVNYWYFVRLFILQICVFKRHSIFAEQLSKLIDEWHSFFKLYDIQVEKIKLCINIITALLVRILKRKSICSKLSVRFVSYNNCSFQNFYSGKQSCSPFLLPEWKVTHGYKPISLKSNVFDSTFRQLCYQVSLYTR